MYRTNFRLIVSLIILALLTSSVSIPYQLGFRQQPLIQEASAAQDTVIRQNDCTGVTTTCVNDPLVLQPPTINQGPQAEIEFDAKRVVDQLNICRDGADCSNEGDETLSLVALDQSSIVSDTVEKIGQVNRCIGITTQCSNTGVDAISISASDQAQVEADASQLVYQANKCKDTASCTNNGNNLLTITASGSSSVDSGSKQDLQQSNVCATAGTFCQNPTASNTITLTASGLADVENEAYQKIKQANKCIDTASCT